MQLFVRLLVAAALAFFCPAAFAVDCALSPTTPCGSLQDDAIYHADVTLGVPANSSYPGSVKIANGGASGVFVTILNPSATTAYNFNLPATAGTPSYLLTSAGGATSPMTWTSPTVTVNGTGCTLGSTCSPAAIASSIVVGTTGVTGGTSAYILYNNGSILGNVAQVPLTAGGTNASLTASNGGIAWSNASQLQILSGTVTAGQMLQSGSSATPAWSTATWPATTTINRILYSSAANAVGEITTGNSSVLVTSSGGVPSLSTALPNGVTATTNASAFDNSTKVATNAFVQNALLLSMATVPMAITTGTYSFASTSNNPPVLNITAVGGAITAVGLFTGGSGFAVGDLITSSSGNHDAVLRVDAVTGGVVNTISVVYGGTGYTSGGAIASDLFSAIPYTYLLSGVLTGDVTIIATSGAYLTASQQWYFANNTTGAHTVTVCVSNGSDACSAGRTAVIPQGTANSRIVGVQTDGVLNVDIASVLNAADLTGTPPTGASTPVDFPHLAARIYYVDDFGAVGNVITAGLGSATDDTAAINAALAQASTNGGGTVCLNPAKAYKATSGNITVPLKVTLSGCWGPMPIQGYGNNYTAVSGALYLSPSFTINYSGSVAHLYVLSSNLSALTTYRQAVTLISGLSGTALTCRAHDCSLDDVVIGGFAKCVYASGYSRPWINRVFGDCNPGASNGTVTIDNSHDIPKLNNVELWPFLTTNAAWTFYSVGVSGVADNGVGVYRYTTATNSLVTGDTVWIAGVGGAQGANTKCSSITVISATQFDCTGIPDAPAPTGNTTNGSPYVTVSSVSGLAPGQGITGTGIPGATTILAVWQVAGAITLSNNATATNAGTALTVTNAGYTTGGTAYIDTNQRSGAGIVFTNTETPWCIGCYVYGYNIGIHAGSASGVGAGWVNCIGCQVDNYSNIADPTSIGVLIDGAAYGFMWNGGSTNAVGESLVVNTTSTTSNQVVTGVVLNNSNGMTIEHDQGNLQVSNSGTNGGNYIGFGPSITSAVFSANWLPHIFTTFGPSAQVLVSWSPSNHAAGATPGTFLGQTGPLRVRGGTLLTTASTTAAASLNIPNGAAPSAPNAGDIWTTSASNGLFWYTNGTTYQAAPVSSPTFSTQAAISAAASGGLLIKNTAGATDQTTWDIHNGSSGTTLQIRAGNDAFNAFTNAMTFTKGTTYSVSSIALATGAAGAAVTALNVDSTQHVRLGNATAPTIASGACGATTNGTIAAGSNDHAGLVQIGAAATTTCAISFAGTWATAPRTCHITPANAAAAATGTTVAYVNPANITTGQFVITGSALENANYEYWCQ